MHPIVPTMMVFGAIMFVVGVIVFTLLGMKRIHLIKILGKEIKPWHFVVVTVGSGITLIMLSILIQKYVLDQPETSPKSLQPAISGNLKYELEAALSIMNIDKNAMMPAINRFQLEYQEALQREDKNTMDLLILEMAHRIRTELMNWNYPENQIEREVEKIVNLLKQQTVNKQQVDK